MAVVPLLVGARVLAAESGAAPAETALEEVTLRYSAIADCPAQAQFVEEVSARVRRPVRFGSSPNGVRMTVTLTRSVEQAAGTLVIERSSSEPTRREFTAATCAEVGSALALVAALALDPNARTEPLSVRAASTDAGDDLTPEPRAAETPVATPPLAPPPSPAPPPPATARAAPHYVAWLGPFASVVVGEAPEVLGLVGLGLGVRSVTPRVFSPSLQLTPLWGKTGVTGPQAKDGNFAWAVGRLEACPVSFAVAPRGRLDPCAAVEVGRLSATGSVREVDVPVSAERWWVAPGATLSLHLSLRGWFVRFGGSALFPATRDEFVFHEPDRRVHQASPVVFGANLGLGFELGE